MGDEGGPGFANGTGRAARFAFPTALAIDAAGDLYVADYGNSLIRKVTAQGVVTTAVNNAGPVEDVAVAPDGAIYHVAAGSLFRNKSQEAPSVVVAVTSTPSGVHNFVTSVAVGSDGTVYFTNLDRVEKITSVGVRSVLAANVAPRSLTVDAQGVLYGALDDTVILRIAPDGLTTGLAGLRGERGYVDAVETTARFHQPRGLAADLAGGVLVGEAHQAADLPGVLRRIGPDRGVATLLNGHTLFRYGGGDIAFDAQSNLYFVSGHGVGRITPTGEATGLAGTFVALPSGANAPIDAQQIAVGRGGETWTVETHGTQHRVRRYGSDGRQLAFGPDGSGLVLANAPHGAVEQGRFLSRVTGMVVDGAGDAWIGVARFTVFSAFGGYFEIPDSGALLRVSSHGEVALVRETARGSNSFVPFSLALDAAGSLYYVDLADRHVMRRGSDGAVVRLTAAALPDRGNLQRPQVAVNGAGKLWVLMANVLYGLDGQGALQVQTLRDAILPGGTVQVATPQDARSPQADVEGNVYLLERNTLWKVAPSGQVTIVAGGATPPMEPGAIVLGGLPGAIGTPSLLARSDDGIFHLHSGGAILRVRVP